MKKTVMVDIPKKRNIVALVLSSLVALCCICVLIVIGVEMSKLKVSNLIEVSGKVSSVSVINERYQIELENGDTYEIYNVIAEKISFAEIKTIENNDVILHVMEGKNYVFGVESSIFNLETEKGLQIQRDNLKIALIFFIVPAVLSTIILIAYIVYLKKNGKAKQKEVDILENFYPYAQLTPARKSYNLKVIISIIVIFIAFLPVIIIEGNKNDTSTLFFTFLFLFIGLTVIWGVLTLSFLPVLRKKDIKTFDEMYSFERIEYPENLENSFLDMANDALIKFEETGISLDKENMRTLEQKMFELMADIESNKDKSIDKEAYKEALKQQFSENVIAQNAEFSGIIPYDELKLSLRIIFRPTGSITGFISSNLPQENKYNLKQDIMVEFTPDSYYFIKKYNVKVIGMDNFMKNRLEFMHKYCTGKPNIQDIED